MADAHKNFATSLVVVAPVPAASGTTLTVTTGEATRFPATPFNAVVCPATASPTPANAEVVRVTNITTDVLTITRTQESSSARTIIIGDRIYAGPTAKSLTDIENDLISETIGDAKGDIVTFTAADTPVRKAVGADGAVLTAKATEGDGVLWKPVAATPPFSPQGFFISPSTINTVANHLYLIPVYIPEYVTVTGVRFKVGSTSAGNCKSVIYSADGQTRYTTSGATAVAATNVVQSVAFGLAVILHAGTYWAGIAFSGTASAWGQVAANYFGPAIDLASSYTTLPSTITPPAMTSQSAETLNPTLQVY